MREPAALPPAPAAYPRSSGFERTQPQSGPILLPRPILVVDAAPESASLLREALPSGEWSVETETNGDGALLRLSARRYVAILVALETPEVGGAGFVRRVRRMRTDAKVIVIAPAATPADVIASIQAHAFAHFSRPFDVDAVIQMIAHATRMPSWKDGIRTFSVSPRWIEFRLQCRLVTADRLIQFLAEMTLDLPAEEREGVSVAFREMLLNAIEYGGRFDPAQTIDVSFIRTRDSLMYLIADPGSGFSIDELPHAAISNPADAPARHMLFRMKHGMRAGGFGILLARQFMDEVIYNERGNSVLLIKHLNAAPAEHVRPG